jgi:large subunit ribosomal protein L13
MEKIERQIHIKSAEKQHLGRLAVEVALLLRGKNKSEYAAYKDVGDFVSVKDIKKLQFTGKKPSQKTYYHHSGYLGGLKEKKLQVLFAERPGEVLRKAVWGMLPKNKLRSEQINRLTID